MAGDRTRGVGMRYEKPTGYCQQRTLFSVIPILRASKVRAADPTSRILLNHYVAHYVPGSEASLANLLATREKSKTSGGRGGAVPTRSNRRGGKVNIVFARNTMSAEIIKAIEEGHQFPWLQVENGKLTEASKKAADEMFLKLGGRVFFRHVEPMKSRSKAPRRGWGELVSELVAFSRKARDLARHWQGESGVQTIAQEIRKVSGFGGKGFRMKETADGADIELV